MVNNIKHINITGLSGNVHVVPVLFLRKLRDGRVKITDLDQYSDIMPIIIGQWLGTF